MVQIGAGHAVDPDELPVGCHVDAEAEPFPPGEPAGEEARQDRAGRG